VRSDSTRSRSAPIASGTISPSSSSWRWIAITAWTSSPSSRFPSRCSAARRRPH
jgi:hypothetical protein